MNRPIIAMTKNHGTDFHEMRPPLGMGLTAPCWKLVRFYLIDNPQSRVSLHAYLLNSFSRVSKAFLISRLNVPALRQLLKILSFAGGICWIRSGCAGNP